MAGSGARVNSARFRRAVLMTLDGLGVGALPDAGRYGDEGAHTLLHVCRAHPPLALPNLCRLGLGRLVPQTGLDRGAPVQAAWGKMAERSAGKDTLAGHWELAGLVLDTPFATFPHGFPPPLIDAFRAATGLDPLGNVPASGTEIIRRLGAEHCRTGRPIVYTSSDSVFQIAAHEEILPVEQLYELCRIARRILTPWQVARVIARPFVGRRPEEYRRTARRHDFCSPPPRATLLDALTGAGLTVHGVGKIHDIFTGRGLSSWVETDGNRSGMEQTLAALRHVRDGLVFVNLVDFDMLYGHRNDPAGFAAALMELDAWLPQLLRALTAEDLLILTADHGCDPTTPGTDHTREYVPVLAWHNGLCGERYLGSRDSFCDVAATLAEALGLVPSSGSSFASQL